MNLNRKKKKETESVWKNQLREQATQEEKDMLLQSFSKERLFTYLWVVFLPPYALYRIWKKDSSFKDSEKIVWTMVIAAYLFYAFRFLLL